jgi:2,4-dichlorophenol 6-monooxygenase
VLDDGTPPPAGHDTAIEFESTARPGHHVPHVWLNRSGEQVSTSDLIAATGLTLFVDVAGGIDWAGTAAGLPVTVIEVGAELSDATGGWAAVRGTAPSGAVLVRPDRHVAWRSREAPADPPAELARVVAAVLRPAASADTARSALAGITDAGEALRVGARRDPRLFSVVD